MSEYTGIITRRLPGPGRVCKEWKVQVEDVPENEDFAGKLINTSSSIDGLEVGDRVALRAFKAMGNARRSYAKLNIRAKIQ